MFLPGHVTGYVVFQSIRLCHVLLFRVQLLVYALSAGSHSPDLFPSLDTVTIGAYGTHAMVFRMSQWPPGLHVLAAMLGSIPARQLKHLTSQLSRGWHSSTLSRPDIVKQFPGPSLPKLMAQFRFAYRFSYWCMLSPQPYTRTVPVLGRTVATLRPALARMPWLSAGHRRAPGLQV